MPLAMAPTRVAAFALLAVISFASLGSSAKAQAALSAEEQRQLEFGKEIFKSKAVCQFCHKWDASGDQGYGGNALSFARPSSRPSR